MKVLVSGHSRLMNLGGPSIFHGIVKVLRHAFPGCDIVYHEPPTIGAAGIVVDPDYPDIRVYSGNVNVKSLLCDALRWKALRSLGSAASIERILIKEMRSAELFVDVWGIDFTDKLGRMNWKGALLAKPLIRMASLFGVKAVHYTASYGPMNHRWTRIAAQQVLGMHCSLVYCREQRSREILLDCGVSDRKLVVAPDTGFLMPSKSVPLEGMDGSRPCVGISVSHQIIRQWAAKEPYLDVIAKLCDSVIQQWDAQVLLIPNELSHCPYDDCAVARDVLARVQRKESVHIFPAERHTGTEQKGAIAQCDLLIASRYHSIVAAMSLGVPTVVIGWHHKYAELLDKFGQADTGLSCETCDFNLLWEQCEKVWTRRSQVRAEIQASLPAVEKRIYEAGESLRSLFTSHK